MYYRKYRPQTISELDLEKVRERLSAILGGSSSSIPHAFLFTGPKGLGKTSSARILAKAINCIRNQEARIKKQEEKTHDSKFKIHDSNLEPCNVCDNCISITNGSNLDVIEIDAASNRGIDEIRDLREKVKFSPSSLHKKVYIIDEVHMLTNDAFNALLKTLEEPPSHVVFILCTTELWKVPPTISSRTFNVSFEKPTKEELVRSMERIVKGENLKIKKEVLEKVYRLSGGSFRDAAKILEELSLNSGNKEITLETLDGVYKSESIENEVFKLIDFVSKKQTKEALGVLENLGSTGIDFEVVNAKIVEVLHRLLLKKTGLVNEVEDIESLNIENLKALVSLFNESYKDIKTSVLPQLPIELSVIKYCLAETNSQADGTSQYKDGTSRVAHRKSQDDKSSEVLIEDTPTGSDLVTPTSDQRPATSKGLDTQTSDMPHAKSPDKHGDLFKPTIVSDNFFASLLDALKKDNHSVAGILRGCKLFSLGEEEVKFETKYKFHKDKLSEDKNLKIIEKRAAELLKRNVRVFVELKK